MEYKYRLVLFINNKKLKEIDIVPNSWIFYDQNADKLKCRFMPPPYTPAKSEQLKNMVQQCLPGSSDWPCYNVELRGRAKTYEEAEGLYYKLQISKYAYSTDDEESSQLKSVKDEEFLKKNTPHHKEVIKVLNDISFNLDEPSSTYHINTSKRPLQDDTTYEFPDIDGEGAVLNTPKFSGQHKRMKKVDSDNEEDILCSCRKNIDYTLLSKQISEQQLQISSMSQQMGQMTSLLMEIKEGIVGRNLVSQEIVCKVNLPCKTLEDFALLEEQIESDPAFRQQMETTFQQRINTRTTLGKNTTSMIKLILSKELALKFNPVKANEQKPHVFQNTLCYKIIRTPLIKLFSKSPEDPLPERDILGAIGSALYHCKDWDGGRLFRNISKNK